MVARIWDEHVAMSLIALVPKERRHVLSLAAVVAYPVQPRKQHMARSIDHRMLLDQSGQLS